MNVFSSGILVLFSAVAPAQGNDAALRDRFLNGVRQTSQLVARIEVRATCVTTEDFLADSDAARAEIRRAGKHPWPAPHFLIQVV